MSLKDLPADGAAARKAPRARRRGAGRRRTAGAAAAHRHRRARTCCSWRRSCSTASAAWPACCDTRLDELKRVKGLGGTAKRAELAAVLEIARRALAEQLQGARGVRLARRRQALPAAAPGRAGPHEVFAVLFLDAQHRLIALEELFRGTLTQTSVYPREVVARALHHHAARRGAGAQPSERQRRALARRRGAHAARSRPRWRWSTCACSTM